MRIDKRKSGTRGALLLAAALTFQGLRLIIPLPPFASMFLIGSLVNMTLVLAALYCGRAAAAFIGCLLPLAAFFQGQLALAPLILLVAAANVLWAVLAHCLWRQGCLLWLAPAAKALFLYGGALQLMAMFQVTGKAAAAISLAMGWPQFITAAAGLWLAKYLYKKIPFKPI